MSEMSSRDVVLAFSGGLDTSFCLVYLRKQGWNVTTVTVDVGGSLTEHLDDIAQRAEQLGSHQHVVIDRKQLFWDHFVTYLIKSSYLRNGTYPSCTGAERTVIADAVAQYAVDNGIGAVAHGSTGAGNDHVRFDVTVSARAPAIEIVAPIREIGCAREMEATYLTERGYSVPEKAQYSVNEGMLGTTVSGPVTKGSWEEIPDDAWLITTAIEAAPESGQEIILSFTHGVPTGAHLLADDGSVIEEIGGGFALLHRLNVLGGLHGVGRGTHVGTTIMGLHARLGFEAPGALILIAAHKELERLVLSARQLTGKRAMGNLYGDLLHEGLYSDPVMRDCEALLDSASQRVTGDVRVKLLKGNIVVLGARSPFSLLESAQRLGVTYAMGSSLWDGAEARGFAKIYGVSTLMAREALSQPDRELVVKVEEYAQ